MICMATLWAKAASDLPVYGDGFVNGFRDWHWTGLDPASTEFMHSGTSSISVKPAAAWEGIYFHHPGFDTTRYESLSFWVHGGTNGGQRLQVQGLLGGANPPKDVYYRLTVPTGDWAQVTVPLASLGIDGQSNCTGFWIQLRPGGSTNVFYVDDVQLNGRAAPAEAMTSPMVSSPPAQESPIDWNVAVWCVAGALVVMTILLAWVVVMLRRSGVGSRRNLLPVPMAIAKGLGPHAGAGSRVGLVSAEFEAFADEHARQLWERMASELAEFAKQSLVQGIYSQRSRLIETQQKAQDQVTALEARLALLQLPLAERISAYEARIEELEKQLGTRDEEMRGMTEAALMLIRDRLEKAKATVPGRFN